MQRNTSHDELKALILEEMARTRQEVMDKIRFLVRQELREEMERIDAEKHAIKKEGING